MAESNSVSPFTDLMANIDSVIADVFGSAANGMSNYIVPIGWVMLGISLLLWSFMIFQGQSQTMNGYVKKLFTGLIIIQFAGSLYASWVAAPLFSLPDALAAALAHGDSSTTALDKLAGNLDHLIIGTAQALVACLKSLNLGGAAVLLVAMIAIAIAGSLLELSVVFNLVYAKIGIACVLAVGPFFVMCLMWKPISKWFFSWLNTVMYFAFLNAFSTLVTLMFIGIANKYMEKLTTALGGAHDAKISLVKSVFNFLVTAMSPGSAGEVAGSAGNVISTEMNILSIALQMVLVFIPLALVAMETRTMVSSITGGSGGSFGSGAMNVVSTAWRGGVGRIKK